VNGMYTEAKKYFKYLDLFREDIREEFDVLGVPQNISRLCDYGCGDGLTTFGLALEIQGAECIGVDLFDQESKPSPEKLDQYMASVERECHHSQAAVSGFPGDLCGLVSEKRLPQFIRGNIVLDHNLPSEVDLAYCKKVLLNLLIKEYKGTPSGEDGLLLGLKHIARNLIPGGLLCAVEYDIDFKLGKYLEMSKLNILKKVQLKRREIRSRGRTGVASSFSLYLCQRV
jgi:SAM-dependent methyltransferase